jgi:hypothetical protein
MYSRIEMFAAAMGLTVVAGDVLEIEEGGV